MQGVHVIALLTYTAGVLGTLTGGVGFLIAPGSIPAAAGIAPLPASGLHSLKCCPGVGLLTGIFKYGWRHSDSHLLRAWKTGASGDARADEHRVAQEQDAIDSKPTVWERL